MADQATDKTTKIMGLGMTLETGTGEPDKLVDQGKKPIDKVDNYLAALVGEGKKYASVEELAKGTAHLSEHLDTILNEKADLEEKFQAKTTSDDLLSQIFQRLEGVATGDESEADKAIAAQKLLDAQQTNDDGPLTYTKIREILASALQERDVQSQEAAKVRDVKTNQATVWEQLSKHFDGFERAKIAVAQYCKGDNKKVEMLNQLASFDPAGAVEYVKLRIKPESVSFGKDGKINVQRDDPTLGLTWLKARAVKEEDPELYESREFQTRLMEARMKNKRFWEGTKRA